jgi:hypothetical protein
MGECLVKHGVVDLTCLSRLIYRTLEDSVIEAGLDLRGVVVRSVRDPSPRAATLLARTLRLSTAELAHCLYRAPALLFDGPDEPRTLAGGGLLEQRGAPVEGTSVGEPVREGAPPLPSSSSYPGHEPHRPTFFSEARNEHRGRGVDARHFAQDQVFVRWHVRQRVAVCPVRSRWLPMELATAGAGAWR